MTPKEIIKAFVEAVNNQDWRRLETLVAPDFVRHSIAAGVPGIRSREDLIRFLCSEYKTFPDAQEQINDTIEEGDKVATRMCFRGTQSGSLGQYPPTGKGLSSEYIAIYRIQNGLIVEAWAEWDNLASLRQLGHAC